MRKHLTTRDRVIIQYQIEHYRDTSLKSLAFDLKCHESTIFRELKRNVVNRGSKVRKYMGGHPEACPKLKQFPYVGAPAARTAPRRGRATGHAPAGPPLSQSDRAQETS